MDTDGESYREGPIASVAPPVGTTSRTRTRALFRQDLSTDRAPQKPGWVRFLPHRPPAAGLAFSRLVAARIGSTSLSWRPQPASSYPPVFIVSPGSGARQRASRSSMAFSGSADWCTERIERVTGLRQSYMLFRVVTLQPPGTRVDGATDATGRPATTQGDAVAHEHRRRSTERPPIQRLTEDPRLDRAAHRSNPSPKTHASTGPAARRPAGRPPTYRSPPFLRRQATPLQCGSLRFALDQAFPQDDGNGVTAVARFEPGHQLG
jgi:hypothetical protein